MPKKPKKVRIKGWVKVIKEGEFFTHYEMLKGTYGNKLLEFGYRPAVLEIEE